MDITIDLAHKCECDVPVAALVVRGEEVISSCCNDVINRNDPTAHAEILAIRKAGEALQRRHLDDCDLYVTLEPCAMCACAISLARIRALYFSSYDEKMGAIFNTCKVFQRRCGLYTPKVYDQIRLNASQDLMKDFFQNLRGRNLNDV